jgi:hypothetical protein
MGTVRRAAAAVVSTTALVGCALISGAADLTVGPADGDSGVPTTADGLDGAPSTDGSPIAPGPDGNAGPTDGAAIDARPPSDGGDGGGRLRDVTFEDGMLVGIHGGDSIFGQANLVSFNTLAGAHSMRIDKAPSGVQVDIPPQSELFATALVRVDNTNGSQSTLFGILPESGGTLAELRVQDGPVGTIQIALAIGGNVVGSGGTVTANTVYRVGIHVKQDATTHLIEIFATAPGNVFGAPVVVSTTAMLGRSVGIRMGVVDNLGGVNNLKSTFDNLFIDALAMPPP